MGNNQRCHNLLTEIIGALAVSLVSIVNGIIRGFTTVALPNLGLDETEGSWFAALSYIGAIIFAPLGGYLIDTSSWDLTK